MELTIKTFNTEIPSRPFTLQDVQSFNFSVGATGGYLEANITLYRTVGKSYVDIDFNYHLQIIDKVGFVWWEGRVHSLPQSGSYQIKAVGYYANLADQTSIWLPYYPDKTELATIILEGINGTVARNGYSAMAAGAPMLVADSTSVPATGTTIIYTPDRASSVREHLDELLSKYGSSTNTTLYFQVLNNRTFYLKSRSAITAPFYSASLTDAESYQIGLNADGFYTRVSVRYKEYYEELIVTSNNTDMQAKYGSTFGSPDPAAIRIPYIREPAIVDITSHGIIDATQAQVVADTLLARYSNEGVRMAASTATFRVKDSILVDGSNQVAPLYSVQPCQMVLWKDVAGLNQLYSNFQSVMFIGQTTYNANDEGEESLTIQSEDLPSPENVFAALMKNLDDEVGA
jgi:hypothetical protein